MKPEINQPGGDQAPIPLPPSSPRCLLIASLVAVLVAGLATWRWGQPAIALLRDQQRVRTWLAGYGPLAPLASVGLNTAQVLLAPVPGQVVALANGYLFGVFWGTVYSLAGVTLGSALAMGLARRLGRPFVERFANPAHLERWDALTVKRGPLFIFLVYFLPLLPDDIMCFAIGLSPLSIPYMLILAAIGRLPGLIGGSWVGANASALTPAGWVLIGTTALGCAGLALHYHSQLETAALRIAERWNPRSRDQNP